MRLRSTLLPLLPLLTTLVGGFVGFYFGTRAGSKDYARLFGTFIEAPYVDAALRADRDVHYLNLLGAGDTKGVANALERDLDGNLEALGDYHRVVPRELRRKAVYDLVARVRPYREAHPSELPAGSTLDAMQRGLQLTPEDSPR